MTPVDRFEESRGDFEEYFDKPQSSGSATRLIYQFKGQTRVSERFSPLQLSSESDEALGREGDDVILASFCLNLFIDTLFNVLLRWETRYMSQNLSVPNGSSFEDVLFISDELG